MLEIFSDSSAWFGLITLVVLEIILGIDNLVFIAILANKLPAHQRNKARTLGLGFALLMRLGLLSLMSWLINLTQPIISYQNFSLSLRDIILLIGGFFLLFKATMELHERLEHKPEKHNESRIYPSLTTVIIQIVVLDAVFSFDAVITAVGMINHLEIMMLAVIIAMALMLFASKMLTDFVNEHPTIVILCLSFLLMIGFSLIAEGLGFHIPKGYLYAAIGFSIVIEAFNQLANRNKVKYENQQPLRERTADAILKLMGGNKTNSEDEEQEQTQVDDEPFAQEERYMISGVLALGERDIQTIMTPRNEISWVNIEASPAEIRQQLLDTPHNLFPVCRGSIDRILGVLRAKDMLAIIEQYPNTIMNALKPLLARQQPIYVTDSIDNLKLLNMLKKAKGNLAIVEDEFGQVVGLVTPLDLLEAIAGEFPDEDEQPEIIQQDDHWIVKGTASLAQLELELNEPELFDEVEQITVSGLLLYRLEDVVAIGDQLEIDGYRFTILETLNSRILQVKVEKIIGAENV